MNAKITAHPVFGFGGFLLAIKAMWQGWWGSA
jgi:hypothetical protein